MKLLFKILILLLIINISGYGIYKVVNKDFHSQGEIPIAPILDKRKYSLNLYFGNSKNDALIIEKRVIVSSEEMEEKVIVEELIKGPRNRMLNSYIPSTTKMISIHTIDGICYVNFSKDILEYSWQNNNVDMMIWSIVNSITEVEHIQAVQILVEGNKNDAFGKISILEKPIYRNEQLLHKDPNTPIMIFTKFLEYVKNNKYEEAYKMIDKNSKEQVDFTQFKSIVKNYIQEIENYYIYMYQTQKYRNGVILVINFRKKTEYSLDWMTNMENEKLKKDILEKWKLIREGEKWRIVLP